MPDRPVIVWFRNDLRLADHAALQAALETGRPIVPVFILDTHSAEPWPPGGASRWWLHHSLSALDGSLRQLGARLILRRGDTISAFQSLLEQTNATEVLAGYAVEPWARRVEHALIQAKLPVRLFRTVSLFEPDAIRTQAGASFAQYTPFSRAALRKPVPAPLPVPARIPGMLDQPPSDALEEWRLLPTKPDWAGGLHVTWRPGETHAVARLERFLASGLENYADQRDIPGMAATSMLSPHLHFGEISAAQLWHAAATSGAAAAEKFLGELLWREFSIHLLWFHPELPDRPLRPAFAHMPWRHDKRALSAWQRGQTGIPIVDAGMRQLWRIGWMHNRVRMITASFLVKHLLIPWQEGEAWFWDTLVDADLANNSASWQWVAGCGADAAPYFRIFNPVLQGKKFDPAGAYVRTWVPELTGLDNAYIHHPWEAPELALRMAGIELGANYPRPIVDLRHGRERALQAFAAINGASRHRAPQSPSRRR